MTTPTLHAASAVVAPPRRPAERDPETLAFHRDLVEPFGLHVDEGLLAAGTQVRHRDLVERLADADGIRDSDPDLVVITHALPDVTPFTAIGPHLDTLLGGRATTFGIHQQGLAAPFTALRALAAYQRSGRSRRAVLAVLETTTLPTRHPVVHDHQLVDSGVLLLWGTEGGPSVAGVEAIPATQSPAPRLRELATAEGGPTLVVAGPWLDRAALAGIAPVHRVNPGTYCTSVWLALARHWRTWHARHRTVVLCDTDPRSGETHLALLRTDHDRPGTEEER